MYSCSGGNGIGRMSFSSRVGVVSRRPATRSALRHAAKMQRPYYLHQPLLVSPPEGSGDVDLGNDPLLSRCHGLSSTFFCAAPRFCGVYSALVEPVYPLLSCCIRAAIGSVLASSKLGAQTARRPPNLAALGRAMLKAANDVPRRTWHMAPVSVWGNCSGVNLICPGQSNEIMGDGRG